MAHDVRIAMARAANEEALSHDNASSLARARRDELIKALRRDDPKAWPYERLAKEIGVSKELIAIIIKGRPGSK